MNINKQFKNVLKLANTRTARSSLIIFAASIFAALLSFVVAYFASRLLGPSDYGRLAIANAIIAIVVGVTDFGLATTLVKHTSHRLEDRLKTAPFFQTVFCIELALGLLILIACLFTNQIADLLGGQQLRIPILAGLLTAFFLSINAYTNAVLQAYGKFKTMAILNSAFAALRTGLFLLLVAASMVTLSTTLAVNFSVAVVVLIVGLIIIPRTRVKTSWVAKKHAAVEIFHFSMWLVLSFVINSILARLDILMISKFTNPEEVGYYAAALQLSSFMPLLLASFSTVLIPKVTSLPDDEVISYIKKVLTGGVLAIIALSPFILLSDPLIHLAFGARFSQSTQIFQILFISYALVLLVNPASFIFYKFNKPKLLTAVNLITASTQVLLYIIFIPNMHGRGAAIALLLNTLISLVVIYGLLYRLLRKQGIIGVPHA